jgi:low affinity Fe/Cu permease
MKQKIAFALIMGMITTAVISFVLISINIGFSDKFLVSWLRSWSVAYVLAVSLVLLVAPRVQLLVNYFLKEKPVSDRDDK